jgi:ketosteroid isomerase-like protein
VLDTALRERLTTSYEAFFQRDLATTMEAFAPDVVAFDAPEMPDTGTFTGRRELEARLAGFLELFGEIELRSLTIEDVGEWAVVHFEVAGRTGASAPPVDVAITHLLRVRDGLCTEMRVFLDESKAREFAAAGT